MSKQNRFGLAVFLENCLVEGLKSECCRFSDLLSVLTPETTLMLQFISSLCSPHAQATISWLDVTLINQSGSKVYNGICSKMLAGSGKKVQVTQKGSQSNQGWSIMIGVPFYIFDAAALEDLPFQHPTRCSD